jgi:hypothetical protein
MSYAITTLPEEICKAKSVAKELVVDSIISDYIKKLFLISSKCGDVVNPYCIFLYSYALDNHEVDGESLLSPAQLNAIILKLERINTNCCNE